MTPAKHFLRLSYLSTIIIALLSIPNFGQSDNPWVGTWNSSYGPMTLSDNNGIISGTYIRSSGELGKISNGVISGNKLTGRWSEPTTYLPPWDAGDFEFTLADDKFSFSGNWRYDQGSFWFGWIGTKGYGIHGKVEMYDGSPFTGCEVELIQNNQTVKKMYTNSSGTFTFYNIQPGTYQVEPFSLDYVFNPKSRTVTLETKSISGIDFKVANTFYITILYLGKSVAYEQEIDLTVEIKDAAGNYINEQHSIQFSEINAPLGSFTPSNGLVTTTNGKATIKYKAPTKTQAGAFGRLLIKAEDKNIVSAENYTILKIPFDLEVWAEPKDPSISENSRIAIIPADEQFPALVSAKCVDASGKAQANVPIKFSLDINSSSTLYSGDQNSKSITVYTKDDGIAQVYYKYIGAYTGIKIIEEVTVENMNDNRVGVVKIEVGLGLEIYKKERYQAQGGIIASGVGQGLAIYIRSTIQPQLDLKSYSVNAEIKKVWSGKDIGIKLTIEWINKPIPEIYDKFFTQPEDEVYVGRCLIDRLGDKNILFALGEPSYYIAEHHSLPKIVPKSEGAHIYNMSATFIDASTGNVRNEVVMVNYPLLGLEVDRNISWFEDLVCAFSPSSSLEAYFYEGSKLLLMIDLYKGFTFLGDIITAAEAACKLMKGDKIGAIKSIANAIGSKLIDARLTVFKDYPALQQLKPKEYSALLAGVAAKWGVAYSQALDSYTNTVVEENNSARLNKAHINLNNINKRVFQDLFNQYYISFFAGAQISDLRLVSVFNASQSKLTDNTEKESVLLDKNYSNMGPMMYFTGNNNYFYILDVNSTFNLEFKTDKNFAVSICDPLKSTYTLYNVPSSQLLKGKLTINNSSNPLQLDYGDNGSIDENKNPEVITPGTTNPPQSKVNYLLQWSKDFGSSINSASFNVSGEKVLTGGADKAVKVWNATTGNLDWTGTHDLSIYSCSFSPDGSKIISAGADGKLKLWNASTGNLIWTADNTYSINYAAFSNDGSSIITSSSSLKLYSASNGNLLWVNAQLYGFPKFSPDGKKIGTGAVNKINMIETVTGNILWAADHTNAREVCFCSDGTRILSTSYDGSLKVWNSQNGNLLLDLRHPGLVISGLFNSDGSKIASYTQSENTVNMWNSNSGTLVWRINEKTTINSIEFSPSGNELMYTCMDTIKIVSTSNGNLLWKGGHYSVSNSKFSKDGKIIASYGVTFPYKLMIWNQTTTDYNESQITPLPSEFILFQNYPNPFNPSTTISYQLSIPSYITLKIYDVLGREIATLVNEFKPAGNYSVTFNVKTRHGASLHSGVYFYQLKSGSFVQTKKLILMK